MDRLLVVSACSYAGAPADGFRPHIDPAHRDELDRWAAAVGAFDILANPLTAGVPRYDPSYVERLAAADAPERAKGAWDGPRRLAEMDDQGVAAEVIFPSFHTGLRPPFDPLHGAGATAPELQLAGARAYNRWLAELCAADPVRLAGVAVVPLHDIDAAIAEVRWARDAGLRGVVVPTIPGPPMDGMMLPKIGAANPALEPVWAACEALGLPVHTLGGTGLRHWGEVPGLPLLEQLNWPESANGSLAPLFLGGILEAHPRLRLVVADQGTRRLADALKGWDATYQSTQFNSYQLRRSPWEYWTRQCSVAPAPFRRSDCDQRHVLGVTQMMWSSRYPQTIGGWLDVETELAGAFAGIASREVRAMVGANAVRVYALDDEALNAVAARIGPAPATITQTAA